MKEPKDHAPSAGDDQDNAVTQAFLQAAADVFGIDPLAPPELDHIPAEDYERLDDAFFLDKDPSTIPAMEAWIAFEQAQARHWAAVTNIVRVEEPGQPTRLAVGRPIINRKTQALHQTEIDAFRAFQKLARAWCESHPPPPRKRRRKRTGPLPQPTSQEIRQLMVALSDAATGRRWEDLPAMTGAEPALRHTGDGAGFNVKLDAPPMDPTRSALLRLLGKEASVSPDALRDEVQSLDFGAVLLKMLCVSLVIEEGEAEVELDDLAQMLGKTPRTAEERLAWRRKVWAWLSLFDRLSLHGRRKGTYTDPKTKKPIDLLIREALFRVTRSVYGSDDAFYNNEPPVEVTLTAGPWLKRLRGNDQVLPYYGDLRKIAAIPSGKPSGELAQRLGIVLNQRFRESQRHAQVRRVGEDKHPTVVYQPFTRRALLELCNYLQNVAEILNGPNPARARTYWDKAIQELQHAGVVGHYSDKVKPLTTGRQGWQEEWLDQPLDIRPGREGAAVVADLHHREKAARKRRGSGGKGAS